MVLTASMMPPLGGEAPVFDLADVVTGGRINRQTASGPRGLLVCFLSAECPYVLHVVEPLGRLAATYGALGVGFIGIASNDPVACPEDTPAELAAFVERYGLGFPVCADAGQAAAEAFGAVCTPDFFLYDGSLRLRYRGRMDETRPWSGQPATGHELEAAIRAILEDRDPGPVQHPSLGCSIKTRDAAEQA